MKGKQPPPRGSRRFVILTGLSGSGKTHAIRALEDLGYFCVDNLPTLMIPTMAELAARDESGLGKVAIVVDVRERGFLKEFPRVYKKLKATPGVEPRLIFLEASHSALVRRFSETRRPHPMARGRSVPEGIQEERQRMNVIRGLADLILDTSNLTVHELRDNLMRMSRDKAGPAEMVVNLVSFGFKHGVPVDADLVFDVRCLPNPYYTAELRPLTGLDKPVATFLAAIPPVGKMLDDISRFLEEWLPHYVQENRHYLTVALGCTGGQHRSVYLVERLAQHFATKYAQVHARHQVVEKK
jgi:UPF0042 nucleotide-binding protein